MSTSSWSQKLQSRLSALADTASPETIQTLAKWIGFNRKYSAALCSALQEAVLAPATSPSRAFLYIHVIHQVLLLEQDDSIKWEKLADLRVQVGETVLLKCLPTIMLNGDASSREEWVTKLTPLLKQWDDNNVFGGPTLLERMRKIVSEEGTAVANNNDDVPSTEPTKDEPQVKPVAGKIEEEPEEEPITTKSEGATDRSEQHDVVGETTKEVEVSVDADTDLIASTEARPSPPRRESASEKVDFDFEKEGIPYAKVEAREFLEPCKAIATLQIARDLRSDAAVTLASSLSLIRDDVKEACREHAVASEIPKELAEEFATKIPEDVLDTDLDEALQNVETFLEIVDKQQAARKRLIQLLIQSRCKFGAEEAAEAFYSTDDLLERLKERKGLLSDAMDLEGLDFVEVSEDNIKKDAAPLQPFPWYKPGGDKSEPDAKRAKLE